MSRRPTAAMRVIGALRLPMVLPFTSASVVIGFNPPTSASAAILPAQDPPPACTEQKRQLFVSLQYLWRRRPRDTNGGGESRKFLPRRGSPPARIGQGRH